MKHGPQIARIAALIGDPARANMLTALMDGGALTASELALEAGITKQTASSHLAKLGEAGLLAAAAQGRHRYYRLAERDVADLLEGLMALAARRGATRTRPGPKEPALRHARVCYDHLAGDLGVRLCDTLISRGWLAEARGAVSLTRRGEERLCGLGLDLAALARSRRPMCRLCLDWSERRHHLAGALGAAILDHVYTAGWARRARGSRAVEFTPVGEGKFRKAFDLA
jgi:DNA-binding transcriptional ArsR family regulator